LPTPAGFFHQGPELVCDGVALSAIADAVGTPAYVYSAATIRERYAALDGAFGAYPHAIHYALKANSTLAIARLIQTLGGGADANSIGEIDLARRAGFPPGDIVFTGVGKAPLELARAVPLGLKAINVESAGELDRIEALARAAGCTARVAIRVNPDIDAGSHPHISTGSKINKFGVPLEDARALAATLAGRPPVRLVALHVHVGSQITRLGPLRRAAALTRDLVSALRDRGVGLEYVDLGGGLGIAYEPKAVPTAAEYASALVAEIAPTGLPIVVEPGRAIVGPAGVLLARVIDLKPRTGDTTFAVLDGGMTELLRPALYGAHHHIEPVRPRAGASRRYEVVGPVCESSDVVGRDRVLPPLAIGDVIAVRDTGAYGSAMASNYNRRPFPAEVLVDTGGWRLVRRRQTIEDMLALETSC
jgi:diaminopimelate decarboxylase